MRLKEIEEHRFFMNWEGVKMEVFSSYKVRNHETKICHSVIHCETATNTFRIPLKDFKRALKNGSILKA